MNLARQLAGHAPQPNQQGLESAAAAVADLCHPSAWPQVTGRLRVRLQQADGRPGVYRYAGNELVYSLVIEQDQLCIMVSPGMLDSWQTTAEQAWEEALRSTASRLQTKQQSFSVAQTAGLSIRGGLCTSGVLTCVDTHVPTSIPRPLLIALPTPQLVLVFSSTDQRAPLLATHLLKHLIDAMPGTTQVVSQTLFEHSGEPNTAITPYRP